LRSIGFELRECIFHIDRASCISSVEPPRELTGRRARCSTSTP
jgi:hypothetical protein